MKLLSKVYEPKKVEDKWYSHWLEKNYFHSEPNPKKKPYTIMIPPPNVTGMLTMGHILNNTLQDILVRKARMEGYETLWLPGTDHAGIATQTRVEKALKAKGKTRYDLGREKFIKLIWDWKEKYGGIIIKQLKKLGVSCDWERERFTLDEKLSKAVRKVFVQLYNKGLIYKGKRIINWCPVSHTALSDEEVIHKEVKGNFWYFKYPFKDDNSKYIIPKPVIKKSKFQKYGIIWPCTGQITSGFGTRDGKPHKGLDIACPEGTPLKAVLDGEVAYSGKQRGYGNVIILKHANSIMTVYAHNQENLVHKDDKVKKGEIIGKVGVTGNTTGAHVHFEVRLDGRAYDPLQFLP